MKLNSFALGALLDLEDMDLLLDNFHPTIPECHEEEFLQIRRDFATRLRSLHGKIKQEALMAYPELTEEEKRAARVSPVNAYKMYRMRTGTELKYACKKVLQYVNGGK